MRRRREWWKEMNKFIRKFSRALRRSQLINWAIYLRGKPTCVLLSALKSSLNHSRPMNSYIFMPPNWGWTFLNDFQKKFWKDCQEFLGKLKGMNPLSLISCISRVRDEKQEKLMNNSCYQWAQPNIIVRSQSRWIGINYSKK